MTYAKLSGLTWDGTIYENEEMGTCEALIPNGGYLSGDPSAFRISDDQGKTGANRCPEPLIPAGFCPKITDPYHKSRRSYYA